MNTSLALILAQVATVNAAYPLTVFESLCLLGEGRFAPGSVKIVGWDETPYPFRKAFNDAELKFSERTSAERHGLEGSLPGLKAETVVVSADGNWVALVEPKRSEGDQRCAVVAREIDRPGLRKYGVVPLEWFYAKDAKWNEVVEQWAAPRRLPGVIIRIGAFAKKGAIIQSYIMTPEADAADRRVVEAAKSSAAEKVSSIPIPREKK